jgi:hypothetical protein
LYTSEAAIAARLRAIRDGGKNIQGAIALEMQKLARLISIDLVLDAGAGGKVLPCAGYRAAASEYLPPELAAIRETENALVSMAV